MGISAHGDFSEGTYRLRLSADQPFGCHNRMVFLARIGTIGRVLRFGRALTIPDLDLIKQAKQVARQEVSWVRKGRRST